MGGQLVKNSFDCMRVATLEGDICANIKHKWSPRLEDLSGTPNPPLLFITERFWPHTSTQMRI